MVRDRTACSGRGPELFAAVVARPASLIEERWRKRPASAMSHPRFREVPGSTFDRAALNQHISRRARTDHTHG
jgi:hypothetical protein